MKTAAKILGGLVVIAAVVLVVGTIGVVDQHQPVGPKYAKMRMLSSAIENYRTDHGHYPTDSATTEQLRPNVVYDPAAYVAASAFLYRCLTEGHSENSATTSSSNSKSYFDFPAQMIRKDGNGIAYFVDEWGHSLGYSTFKNVHPESPDGYNITYDLWFTGGDARETDTQKWIKNW